MSSKALDDFLVSLLTMLNSCFHSQSFLNMGMKFQFFSDLKEKCA